MDFTVRAGAVHALLGENGAGKSTLVKVIAGALAPDAGSVLLDGREVRFGSTAEAVRHGVAVVSQELNDFPDLDVLANLYPMREPRRGPFISRREMAARARRCWPTSGWTCRCAGWWATCRWPAAAAGDRQGAADRAARADPGRAHLGARRAVHRAAVRRAAGAARPAGGRGVRLAHPRGRDGAVRRGHGAARRAGGDGGAAAVLADRAAIVEAMLGSRAAVADPALPSRVAQAVEVGGRGRLELRDVTVFGRLGDVSLSVGPGEVVGLAGVAGAGHHTVLELVSGLARPDAGSVVLPDGRRVPRGLRSAVRAGVALVPGDRRRLGLMLDKPLWENIGQVRAVGLAADGFIVRAGALRARARSAVAALRIASRSVDQPAGSRSGGNQQKVVFAKWLDAQPSVVLLDDPTRGVDVGAKAEMHALIRSTAAAGAPVLICSTDIDELASLCDRVLVLRQGRVRAELAGEALRTHAVLEAMNAAA